MSSHARWSAIFKGRPGSIPHSALTLRCPSRGMRNPALQLSRRRGNHRRPSRRGLIRTARTVRRSVRASHWTDHVPQPSVWRSRVVEPKC